MLPICLRNMLCESPNLLEPPAARCSYMMGCLYVDREASARKRGGAGSASTDGGSSANGSGGSDSDAAAAQPRVSDAVRRRMDDAAAGRLPGARPLLLFPEGTTTNGRYLLPFKTGAFLAGQPLQPVVIRYGEVGPGGQRHCQSKRACCRPLPACGRPR